MFRFKPLALSTLAALSLVGCGGATTDDGTLSLNITDAPVDAANHVWVQFSGIEVQGNGGSETFSFDQPKRLDLLTLQGSESAPLLEQVSLPAGDYQWIRLLVDAAPEDGTASSIVLADGSEHALTIPSGEETGLKLMSGFTIAQGGSADFTVDFDVRKSVLSSATGYTLKPALRMVDNAVIGHLGGSVDPSLMSANGCTESNMAVYLFAGADVAFDDVGAAGEPLSSALVAYDGAASQYAWRIGFLEPGQYTVALTCQADQDDPVTDDAISAVGTPATVSITTGGDTGHDFQ